MQATTGLLSRLRLESQKNPPLRQEQKNANLAKFVNGLIAIINSGLCHGDIKPQNWLLIRPSEKKEGKSDITDFGGSKIIYPVAEHMKPEFRLESESDKFAMKNIVVTFLHPNPTPKQLETAAKVEKKVNQLLGLNILKRSEKGDLVVVDRPKLEELRAYLATEFLPAKTDAYASNIYIQAMCDYFWRCDVDNYKKACNAFDMRAAGITMYQYIAGTDQTPANEHDDSYYNSMPDTLVGKVSRVASDIICRMAKPLAPKEGHPNVDFETPVSMDELHTLKAHFEENSIKH
ncbi:MAG: serine/threonine protein kinase [Verrucomicrobia bacterium]|nr:serine/threonine protein kinase [Verrucomicrobiota bacterium]MBS0637279.1 serine/threonine protein kinase [Verrucomicrobiota bacterium]